MTPQSQCVLEKNSVILEEYKSGVSIYNKLNWEANMHVGTKRNEQSLNSGSLTFHLVWQNVEIFYQPVVVSAPFCAVVC